jgi:hypothetical protein
MEAMRAEAAAGSGRRRLRSGQMTFNGPDRFLIDGAYLDATQTVLQKHSGLWFNDETFVVTRR